MGKPVLIREELIKDWRQNRAACLVLHPDDKTKSRKKKSECDTVVPISEQPNNGIKLSANLGNHVIETEAEHEAELQRIATEKREEDSISSDYKRFLSKYPPSGVAIVSPPGEVHEQPKQEEVESTHLTEYFNDGVNQHIILSHPGSLKR